MASFQGTKLNPTRFHASQLKFYLVLAPVAAFMVMPIVFIFSHALKPMDELYAFPPRFFAVNPTLDNFRFLLSSFATSGIPVSRYLFNSAVITAVTVVATIYISAAAGYAFSKKKFRLKNALFTMNTLALMFVPIAVSIPRYFLVVQLGLINHFLINILPLLAMPVGLFLIKQFIDQIPDELIEAAQMDGAGDWTIFRKIILPMTMPAVATIAILAFQLAWNSADSSQLYINDEELKNFAYYMSSFTQENNEVAGQGIAAAAALIMFVPNLLIFIFMQSKVMNTMAHSGLK